MRKLFIRLTLTFAAVTMLLFLVVYAVSFGEDMVVEYEHYSGAVADGGVERGWIPPFVPESARAIREVHNLETKSQWLRFEVPAADARQMTSELMPVPATVPRMPPRWSGPWPEQGAATAMRFYRDTTSGLGARCVAVEPLSADPATIYAWTC